MRKGCTRTSANQNHNFLQFLAIQFHCVRKSCDGQLQIAILFQFLAIEPHFVRKGCIRTSANQNRNFTPVFGDRTSFRAKGLHSDKCKSKSQFYFSFWRSNFISCERVAPGPEKSQFYPSFWRSNFISCERVAFRAVSLALPAPSREK